MRVVCLVASLPDDGGPLAVPLAAGMDLSTKLPSPGGGQPPRIVIGAHPAPR